MLMMDSIQDNNNETTDNDSALKPQVRVQYNNFEKFMSAVLKVKQPSIRCDFICLLVSKCYWEMR